MWQDGTHLVGDFEPLQQGDELLLDVGLLWRKTKEKEKNRGQSETDAEEIDVHISVCGVRWREGWQERGRAALFSRPMIPTQRRLMDAAAGRVSERRMR